MSALKWGVGTVVSVAAVYVLTYLAVVALLLPILIPVVAIASIWAAWPLLRCRSMGRHGTQNASCHRGYRDGNRR